MSCFSYNTKYVLILAKYEQFEKVMAQLKEIIQWCDQTLNTHEFKDYAPNGLQIEGKSEVQKILCAVTASQEAIDAAIAQNADLLLVHHGYFWKGEPYPITGMRGKRIKSLIQHDISLVGYHLPLDSHPSLDFPSSTFNYSSQVSPVRTLRNSQLRSIILGIYVRCDFLLLIWKLMFL